MSNNDENTIRVRYDAALKKYMAVQEELSEALRGMHGIGEYPSPPRRLRFPLDQERKGTTRKFQIGFGADKIEGYATSGTYSDGVLGEVFILAEKQGSLVSGLMDAFATMFSFSLQSGVQLPRLLDKLKYTKFEPAGVTTDKDIPMASSIMDYLGRWLEMKYLATEQEVPR